MVDITLMTVPAHARDQWAALTTALERTGPAPCERGAADDWWSTAEQAAAMAACEGCGARVECLRYALTAPEIHGIWGGMTAEERRRLPAAVA